MSSDQNATPLSPSSLVKPDPNNNNNKTNITGNDNTSNQDDENIKIHSSESSSEITLPQILTNMVPLKTVVERLVNHSYTELINLMEIAPNMSSVDRKSTLLQYLTSHLTHFTRALVLAKYSSLSPQIQSLQNIIGFLQLNDTYFESTHRLLFETAQLLQNARARNYDIPNAIDTLTKGNYLRLPKIIKNSFCEQDKISKEEQKETIEKLNDIILRKILMEEVVPVEMLKCWKVASGTITFIVENEFKVTLTIDGASSQSCWRILDLKILAANTKSSESSLAPYQIGHLIHIAQQQLIPPQTTSSEQQINKPSSPSSTPPVSRHPLLSLYQTLHSFSLSLQHELLYLQAVALARLRWKGLLKVDINRNENIFRVGYWGQNHWITIKLHDSDRIIEVSSFTPSAQSQHQTLPASMTTQQSNLPSPQKVSFKSRQSDLILSVSAFPSDKSSTSVRIPLPDTQSLDVDLKSVNYDMEAFLNRVLGSHAIHVLMGMVESVNASLASNTRKSGNFGDDKYSLPVFKGFGLDDVVIDFEQSTLTKDPVPPTLRLRCRSNMYLSISVDIRSGKLTVTEETESADSNRKTNPSTPNPHIRFVEEVINVDSSKLVSAVNALNCLLLIDQIATVASYINLTAFNHIPIANKDLEQFQNLTHRIYLGFPGYKEYYIVAGIADNKLRMWLLSLRSTSPQGTRFSLISATPVPLQSIISHVTMNKAEIAYEDYTEVDDASHKRRILSTSIASRKRQRLDVGNLEAYLSFSNFEVLSTISDVCKLWIYRDAVSSQLSTQSITPAALSSSSSVGRDCIIQIPASCMPSSIIPTVSVSKYFSDITIHMSTVATSNPSSPSIEFSTSFSLRHFKMFSALKSSFHTRCTLVLTDPDCQNKPGELILAKVPHRSSLKLLFVYHDIENVVSRFLNDLNRVRIMTVLLKQLKGCISGRKLNENSESDCPPRLERFKKLFGSGSKGVMNGVDDQENHDCVSALTIELVSFNFMELRLKYAKEFGFTVTCDVAQKSDQSTIPFHTSKQSGNIHLSIEFFSQNVTSTNPHTFVHRYMELALNSHYSIPSFLRLLHATTYPLLLLHNYVDSTNTHLPSSSANRVRIIPRSSTHFRLFFPPCFGADIKVVPDQNVICLSDVTCSPFDAGGVIPKVPPPATLQETPSTSFIDSISYNPIPRFTSFFSKLDAILFSSSSLNSLTPAQVPQTAQAKAPNPTTVATSEPQVQEIQPQDDFFDMLNLDSLESAGPVSPKFSALLDSLTENSSLDNSMEVDHTLTSSNPNSGMTLSTSKAMGTVKNQLESGNDPNRFKSFQIPYADDLLLVLPRCIIFGTNLFGTVLEELRKSLVTPILFEKLHVGVKSVPGVLQRDDLKLVVTARGLEFTVFVDAQGQWKFSVASKDIQSFSQDEANRLTNQLNQTITTASDVESALRSFVYMLHITPNVLKDCLRILSLPRMDPSKTGWQIQWVFTVPADNSLPKFFKTGEPALQCDIKGTNINLMFKISTPYSQTIYLPLRYSPMSNTIAVWDGKDVNENETVLHNLSASELMLRMKEKSQQKSSLGRTLESIASRPLFNCVQELLTKPLDQLKM